MWTVKVMLFLTFLLQSPFQESGTFSDPRATLECTSRLNICCCKGVPYVHSQICIINYLKSCDQFMQNSSLRRHCLLLFTPNLQEDLERRTVMQDTRLQHCSAVLISEVPFSRSFAFSKTRLKHQVRFVWIFSLSYCLCFWVLVSF